MTDPEPGHARSEPTGRRRRLLMAGLIALAGALVAGLALHRALAFDAPQEFWSQKGSLADVSVEPADSGPVYREYSILLASTRDYRVRGYLRVPREAGPWPALIVLGGIDTGRQAARLIEPDSPYVILGLDYPWDGPTRLTAREFTWRLLAIRRALLLTPSAVMLAMDYLADRPDVSDAGITMVGASFGAPLATVAGALHPRAGPVVLVYGGGDFRMVIAANLARRGVPLKGPVARIGGWLTAPIEPLRYIGDIAPRPVVLVNGRHDDRIPLRSVERLYAAAGEPRRLIWLDTGHIGPRKTELLDQVLQAAVSALEEIEEQGMGAADLARTGEPVRSASPGAH